MKKLIFYLIPMLILIISCSSPEKLLKDGDYDKLVKKLIKKAEKENGQLEDEWIEAGLIALERLQKHDSILVTKKISQAKSVKDWKRLKGLVVDLHERQTDLSNISPLMDDRGRLYPIKTLPTDKWLKHVNHNINAHYYQDGLASLEEARRGYKLPAMQAIRSFNKIKDKRKFTELENLINESQHLAEIVVKLEESRTINFNNRDWVPIARNERQYLRYVLPHEQEEHIDLRMEVTDLETAIGFYDESANRDHYSKEIVVRTETEKYWNPKDSTWTTREVEITEKVYATITTVRQRLDATGQLQVVIYNKDFKPLKFDDLRADAGFRNEYTVLEGDARALDFEYRAKGAPMAPPSRRSMIGLVEEQLILQLEKYTDELDYWRLYDGALKID